MNLKQKIRRFLGKHCPRLLVTILHKMAFGRWIDWNNPKTLNEKIQWLKFNSDTSMWPLLADKYRVRKYVQERGCEDLLVTLYGVWDKAQDIDWNSLPNTFVMKVNNGCGDVRICNDKTLIDIEEWTNHFEHALQIKIGYERAELHYNTIKPCIIAEEMLDFSKQQDKSVSLIDYKVWCFEGEPHNIFVCANRANHKYEISDYDLNWNPHPERLVYDTSACPARLPISKPIAFEKMIQCAKLLSKGLHQVRVDFYEVDGKLYFGEMTMTGAAGFMTHFTDDFQREMGSNIKLRLNDECN